MSETILDWNDIAGQGWRSLLVGNGASIAIWVLFRYTSLYDRACSLDKGGLEEPESGLFEQEGTDNFEGVLLALRQAERVATTLQVEAAPFTLSYDRVKSALAAALKSVHLPRAEVPDEVMRAVRTALRQYRHVFSLNYDLLIYWAILSDGPKGFTDYYFSDDHVFDASNVSVSGTRTRVLFLHGGIHLETPDGVTVRKRASADVGNLLDAFGDSLAGDRIPLIVTEGRWQDKLAVIRQSEYLRFAIETFETAPKPLVVFGASLENDGHLLEVMNSWGRARIAVSVHGSNEADRTAYCGKIRSLLPEAHLVFFAAATHPLGSDRLRVPLEADKRVTMMGGIPVIVRTLEERIHDLARRAEGLAEAIDEKHYEYMQFEAAGVDDYLPYIQMDIATLGSELANVRSQMADFGVPDVDW